MGLISISAVKCNGHYENAQKHEKAKSTMKEYVIGNILVAYTFSACLSISPATRY
jgi:hypothetical protein